MYIYIYPSTVSLRRLELSNLTLKLLPLNKLPISAKINVRCNTI